MKFTHENEQYCIESVQKSLTSVREAIRLSQVTIENITGVKFTDKPDEQ